MPEITNKPAVSVSVAMKINLGNYESADAFLALSGLEAGTSQGEIDDLLDTGKLAWIQITARLQEKVIELRKRS